MMQKPVKGYLNETKRSRRRCRRLGIAAVILAVCVTGTAAEGLIQPATVMAEEIKCRTKEHEHTDACYQDELICAQEKEPPGKEGSTSDLEPETDTGIQKDTGIGTSDAEKGDDAAVLDTEHFTEADMVKEQVSDGEETTTDGEREVDGAHSHTDSCFAANDILECGEEHEHTADCYRIEKALMCEESAGSQNTDDCDMDADDTEHVDRNENIGQHIHTPDCYITRPVCGLEEHRHSEECHISDFADREEASDWETLYKDVVWKNSWAEDLLASARLQVGYKESEKDYQTAEDGSRKGYTRYGQFHGDPYVDWNTVFVNFCLYYAKLADTGIFPDEPDADIWYDKFVKMDQKNSAFLALPENYVPKAGDLVFLESAVKDTGKEETEPKKRMGIVSLYGEEKNEIMVIEGDSDNEVKENTYDISDAGSSPVRAYLMITELEKSLKTGTLTAEGEDYTVSVCFTEEAALPPNTVLNVREIKKDSGEYQIYYKQSLKALNMETLSFARCFDITFQAGNEVIEPSAPVKVTITDKNLIQMEQDNISNAVHFARDGVEVLDAETERREDHKGYFFRFDQDSFSVTMITGGRKSEADDNYICYRHKITSLDELDGKSFLITNLTSGTSAMKGETGKRGCLSGDTFNFRGNQDVLKRSGAYIWKFERDLNTSSGFTIYNIGTDQYLRIEKDLESESGNSARITLGKKMTLNVSLNDAEGTIAISGGFSNHSFYIGRSAENHAGGGNDVYFAAQSRSNNSDISTDHITLFSTDQRYIVLNPYNIRENGSNSPYRFKVDGKEGPLNKIAVEVTANIASMKITLPDDATRKRNFMINSTSHSIKDSDNPSAYRWKLKGWYNLASGEYISVESGPKTVTIDLRKNNVFYADWVAADYDNGKTDGILGTPIPTVSAEISKSFMTTELYDYNELANITLHRTDPRIGAKVVQNDALTETWTAVNNLSGRGFGFLDGAYNYAAEHNAEGRQKYVGIKGALGYPLGIDRSRIPDEDTDDKIFDTLFGQKSLMGIQYLGNAAGLYQLDDKGYYEYNSDRNAASYNQSAGQFYVYGNSQKISRKSASQNDITDSFLPLNGESDMYTHMDGQVNYWFGMKTEINYWLNDQSGGADQPNYNHGEPMIFHFTGDDDLWVFDEFDGKRSLILNLSGVHAALEGSINFSTGVVTYQGEKGSKDQQMKTEFQPGLHKLIIYYMDRGAGLSNCKIRFNLVPSWSFEGEPVQAVSVTKRWLDAEGKELAEQDGRTEPVTVKLFEKSADGISTEIDAKELTSADDWTYTWKYLNKDKNYEVREVESLSCNTTVSEPKSNPCSNWIETGNLEDGDRIVIGNGMADGTGRILAEISGVIATVNADVSNSGDVLISDGAEDRGLPGNWQWIVHADQSSANGHLQFRLESAGYPGWYLNIKDTAGPKLIRGSADASMLYFSGNGNLTGTSANRLIINSNGTGFEIAAKRTGEMTENGGDVRRVHLYKYDERAQSGCRITNYTITNTLIAARLQIQKVNLISDKEALRGAEFKIYGQDYYSEEGMVNNSALPVVKEALVSGMDGSTSVTAPLPVGIYYLVETDAPKGYALLTHPIRIKISKDGTGAKVNVNFQIEGWEEADHVTYDETGGRFTIAVPNRVLYDLPSTGGPGICGYISGGMMLVLSAGWILYQIYEVKRRGK